jgi:hypothetical protein
MRVESVARELRNVPTSEWPKHLRLAQKILIDELSLDDARALAVIVSSCRAAHSCAREINQRSRDIADFARRLKVRRIFERIANCARRSPANLQRVLNHGVHSAIDEEVIDTETIELLIDNLLAPFASVPRNEASLTALRATVPKSMRSNINGRRLRRVAQFLR